MTDSSPRRTRRNYGSLGGSTRSRRSRASLRAPSNRSSSIVYDEYLHPSGPVPPQALRSASSRFSLNEQFATSRQDYDFSFDDDDASSIYERVEPGIEDGGGILDDSGPATLAAIDESWQSVPRSSVGDEDLDTDYYDLLCLPRDPAVTPHQIRQAYWRSLFLLHTSTQARASVLLSNLVLVRLQRAFETLADPVRRAEYDTRRVEGVNTLGEAVAEDGEFEGAYRDALIDRLGMTMPRTNSITDVGVRFDVSRARDQGDLGMNGSMKPMDFFMDHALTTVIPVSSIRAWKGGFLQLHHPELTVSGLVAGRLTGKTSTPGFTRAHKTQPWPSLAGTGLVGDAALPLAPIVAFKLRQDITLQNGQGLPSRYTIECEKELLAPGLTARASHPLYMGTATEPLILDATLHTGQTRSTQMPVIGVGIHHVGSRGTFSATINSGSWGEPLDATCKSFAEFSRRLMLHGEADLNLPPNLELGYSTHDADFVSLPYRPTTPGGGLLLNSTGSWSVSSQLTPHSAAGCMRYAKDVIVSSRRGSIFNQKPTRLEAEVSSDSLFRHSLALRSLWRVGTYSCLGLEISLGSQTVHLSLHWSRLKHRFSLPLLITSPASTASASLAFWLAAVPFSMVAGMQVFLSKKKRHEQRAKRLRSPEELQAYVAKKQIEAVEFTKLIAPAVEANQQQRRRDGELVVLSALFGAEVADRAGGSDADVTTALAALIDDEGQLFIPAGVRKAGLPGFWDAAPGQPKTLRVRYAYQGQEGEVEVTGRHGLRLPPM